jgi:hypothetical protein
MTQPLLSILICSIPSRMTIAQQLYEYIIGMVGDKQVEVLMLMDNKVRTIGEKREDIKNICRGKYFMFVDDDDSLYELNDIYEACKGDVDVITFKNRSLNSSGKPFIVDMQLGHPVEHNNDGEGNYTDIKRPPFPCCAWHEKFKIVTFPPISYGEDAEWVKLALSMAVTSTHIAKVLHGYNFDPGVSEAGNGHPPTSAEYTFEAKINWTESPRRCIVNLVTNDHYKPGQNRLKSSVKGIDVITFQSEYQVGAPLHDENNYAFKIYAIEECYKRGYEQILWLDASVYSVGDPAPVFDWLTDKGIFMEEAGHYAGSWCNDRALKYFGITREQAMSMPMFAAGYVGFDFRNPVSIEFFAEWKEAMKNGIFNGSWSDHRHDMVAGSIIANKRGLLPLYSSGGHFFAYVGDSFNKPLPSVVFNLRGIS